MMLALYRATAHCLTPLISLWLQRRIRRGKEDAARLGERFGHASVPRPPGRVVWLHAASVGETQSVLTLLRTVLDRDPALHILITTGTVTSAALVAQQALPRTTHQFMPVDTPASVRRFLIHWRPNLVLWVESEFWPTLLLATHARGIPVLLINARMSAKSFANWRRWPRSMGRILGCFSTIFAGSHEDAQHLRALGAAQVIQAGNLKFDAATLTVDTAALATLTGSIGHRPVWVAASTHAGEDALIAQAHRQIAAVFPTLLTILVPRHAVRGDAIAITLRADGLHIAQRSKNDALDDRVQIYLADTMGELGTFYALAPIVMIGGSLIAHGGHNPLEPARQSCAIVSGQHMHNFASITQQLCAANAMVVVPDVPALAQQVTQWLAAPQQAQEIAARAMATVAQSRGASDAILDRIAHIMQEQA